MINVTAYMIHFINNLKLCSSKRKLDVLSVSERFNVQNIIIQFVQRVSFSKEVVALQADRLIFLPLSSFLADNVMRIGGRIDNASLSYDKRHPIILPSKCKFSEMYIQL